jgi:uncharacterized membrane protein YebE (DUF533 family)
VDAERLIGSLVQGAFAGRGRRGHGALRLITGGRGSLLNAGNLLTVAGLAWGVLESMSPNTTVQGAFNPGTGAPPVAPPLPPLPDVGPPAGAGAAIPQDLLRVVRLTISAARADGDLSEGEKQVILSHAREAGVEQFVEQELGKKFPLSEIVAGMTDPAVRRDLYTLAFAVVHADQGVSGAERIYLAQLALSLGLDDAAVQQIERTALEKIRKE